MLGAKLPTKDGESGSEEGSDDSDDAEDDDDGENQSSSLPEQAASGMPLIRL